MPYFVFRVSAEKTMKLVDTLTRFREAKNLCSALRESRPPGDTDLIRMAFAPNEQDARRLLLEKRQISSPLEEWEG